MDSLEGIEITPRDVAAQIKAGTPFFFVDVREPWEYNTARIDGSVLIPLREIPANLERLRGAGEIVFFCHRGMRSLDAAAWVRSQGIVSARSMSGGIEQWSTEIDPQVPRY
jgi:rhodanese-related sulfurtransferase